ncbi:MAG: TrkA family potassium uptake protein [Dehalococcoidales bacterium]|nr:TrkA family potassium uptake protein [Dehalococcoidales bacterium]
MYIIVIGAGRVGYYLTKALLDEGHEVAVVEKDATICETINDEMGSICIRGDGCEVTTLSEVGIDRADMLVAVTGMDEDNLVACQVGKYRFNVPRTIARIRNPRNASLFKKLGVDVTISSTDVILEHIEEEVPTHPLTHLLAIEDSGLEIVEIKISPESSAVGKAIKDLSLPPESRLLIVIREKGKYLVVTAKTILQAGDRIIAMTTHESEEALRIVLRGA